MIFYDDGRVTLHHGDCRDVLRDLSDASVQCVVTSPPYWGLRDYGTATWDGGDPACQHVVGGQVQDTKAPGAITSGVRPGVDASTCRACGARRIDAQIGLDPTPEAYVATLVDVFREVRRVLRDDGVLWLNLGDSYTSGGRDTFGPVIEGHKQATQPAVKYVKRAAQPVGLKPKDLVGIPWRVAFALQADGWYLRADVIWSKPNPMPESVTDRPTKAHEYLFLFAKSERYFYDAEAIKEPLAETNAQRTTAHYNTAERYGLDNGGNGGLDSLAARMRAGSHNGRNRRSVWTIATQPYPEAHFATFPPDLVKPCILAGSRPGDVVLDPFGGALTTVYVAKELNRRAVAIELNEAYLAMGVKRLRQEVLPL